MKKKILVAIMSIVMTLTFMPAAAFADTEGGSTSTPAISTSVATADELAAALANGGLIKVTDDIELDSTMYVITDATLIADGKTFTRAKGFLGEMFIAGGAEGEEEPSRPDVDFSIIGATLDGGSTAEVAGELVDLKGGCTVNLKNVILKNNNGDDNGGAVYAHEGCTLNYDGGSVTGNTTPGGTDQAGGGIYNQRSNVTLNGVVFKNNYSYRGGAIYNTGGNLNAFDCDFESNSSANHAAAISFNSSVAGYLYGCDFKDNAATGQGGAMWVYQGASATVTAQKCTFSGNSGTNGAAINVSNKSVFNLYDTTIGPNTGSNDSFFYTTTGETTTNLVGLTATGFSGVSKKIFYGNATTAILNVNWDTCTCDGRTLSKEEDVGNKLGVKETTATVPAAEKSPFITSAELSQTSFEYDGTAKTPSVTVKYGESTLTEDTDYTVEYFDNAEVGKATALVTAKGNYKGVVALTFELTGAVQIGDMTFKSLDEAFAAAKAGDTIKLLSDVETAGTASITEDMTLDLNGHKLTQTNAGKVAEVSGDATLTINGEKEGSEVYGRFNIGKATDNNGKIIANGGTFSVEGNTCFHVNGTCTDSGLELNGATVTSSDDNAVQLNGAGEYVFNNSTISGATGIYMKAGRLELKGTTTVKGTKSEYTPAAINHNGSNATGDAIVMDTTEGYRGQMVLIIPNGEDDNISISSAKGAALNEALVEGSTSATQAIIISSGSFESAEGQPAIVASESFLAAVKSGAAASAITGGEFNAEIPSGLFGGNNVPVYNPETGKYEVKEVSPQEAQEDANKKAKEIEELQASITEKQAEITEKAEQIASLTGQLEEKTAALEDAIKDANAKQTTINNLKDEIAGLNDEIMGLIDDIDELESNISSLNDQVKGLQDESAAKTETINGLNTQIEGLNAQIDEMKTATEGLNNTIAELQKKIDDSNAAHEAELAEINAQLEAANAALAKANAQIKANETALLPKGKTTYSTATITWTANESADGYVVTGNSKEIELAKDAVSYKFTGLKTGKSYTIAVKAFVNNGDEKVFGNEYSVTVKPALGKATLATAKNSSKKALKASWKKVSGASKYQVQIAKNKKFTVGKKSATVKTLYKTFKTLTKGKTYYVKVRAVRVVDGKSVYGPWSAVKACKIVK